ncbi:hypothetical protein [Nioella nitratireducens]|uniref:hypothetical protein n=1 Tax=Nioella nitratireducens TaxID=1287720 RepID=UPI0008FD7845|nr:hypothetical protein [Nioella nitratireducens]
MASIDYAHSGTHTSIFARIGAAIARAATNYVEARSRAGEISRLQSMSDAELARMGLKRDDIARHVFRDILYI